MATGAGWQHYYNPAGSASTGKYNSTSTSTSTSTSFPSGLTLEYTQDLHLKMSKKIAQLTKWDYAGGQMALYSLLAPGKKNPQ
ncbi:protein FAM184A-like [Megalobrama amblycephala]|uniref:protein FAM184A-like n=1 Tax=Megalobrama amblycephala TaxID=75352 RepID=UPI0020142957|nr:protein FAM184A-like [Megalobrama amblycephala]